MCQLRAITAALYCDRNKEGQRLLEGKWSMNHMIFVSLGHSESLKMTRNTPGHRL